jgi:tryptophan halogenase
MHPFGSYGKDLNGVRFHQFWLKQQHRGLSVPLGEYSLSTVAAKKNKFLRPVRDPNSVLSTIDYAFHFDAGLYARYLRKLAEQRGVSRVEGKIKRVEQRDDGFITALELENGLRVSGDLFIDCTGFRGVLIEQTLKTGYEDWTEYLPCDRAAAVPSSRTEPLLPYTRASAREAGWQWRIPLQHRVGNGHVYCSRFIGDDEAIGVLLKNLDGERLGEPRIIPFTTGRRKLAWNKNCVALGLAAGFMEPLESTSIHLIQSGIAKLMSLFPTRKFNSAERDEYNRLNAQQWEHTRDFLIAHYKINRRSEPFWRQCANMEIPASLRRKLDLYSAAGRFFRGEYELFDELNWTAVLIGQGFIPEGYDPLVDIVGETDFQNIMEGMYNTFRRAAEQMPSHADFVRRNCMSQSMAANT